MNLLWKLKSTYHGIRDRIILGMLLQSPRLVHKYHFKSNDDYHPIPIYQNQMMITINITISISNDDYHQIPLYRLGHHIPLYQLGHQLPLDHLGHHIPLYQSITIGSFRA